MGSTTTTKASESCPSSQRNRNRPANRRCSQRMATFLQMLKETGARCGEIWQLKWEDIDFESKVVNITPEKDSNPRVIHLSSKLIEMLTNTAKKLRRKSILTPRTCAVDNFAVTLSTPTKTMTHKLRKPKTNKNPLPHLPILERNHTLPPNKRHVLRYATLRPQKHQKHARSTSNLKKHSSKAKHEYISKVAKNRKRNLQTSRGRIRICHRLSSAKIFKKRSYNMTKNLQHRQKKPPAILLILVQGVGFEPPVRWRHRQFALFYASSFPSFLKLFIVFLEKID